MSVPVVTYEPIKAVKLAGGLGFPKMVRQGEAVTLTMPAGVPVTLDGSGNLIESNFGGAVIVFGFTSEPAHNLAVAATAQDLSEGVPPNQPSGITTPVGAWPRDGKLGVYAADGKSVFSASLKAGQVYTDALLIAGTLYRIIKDGTTGFWYVDNTLTGGNAGIVNLLGVDSSSPNTAAGGTRVFFQVDATKRYFA